jgi:hypothetical protein
MFPNTGIRQTGTLTPMTLSNRLITQAKDADTAGYMVTAEQLVQLAITVFDEAPRQLRRRGAASGSPPSAATVAGSPRTTRLY